MQIRSAQVIAFEAHATRQFEQEMLDHVKEFSPDLARVAGDDAVSTVVKMAIARGAHYGFTNRGPVRLYIEMMVTFGSEFDTDPLLPWAGRVLSDQQVDQKTRAEHLYSLSQDYLVRVAGPSDEGIRAALRRGRAITEESFERANGTFEARIMRILRTVYPEKCEYVGQAALDTILEKGRTDAQGLGMAKETSIALVIALMFALGHGIIFDPLYPWVGQTLRDELVQSADSRAKRLRQKLNLYIDHARFPLVEK